MISRKFAKNLLMGTIGAALSASAGIVVYAVHSYSKRSSLPLVRLKDINGIPIRNVEILAEDGVKLSAWLLDNNSPKMVILLSGRGNDRSNNIKKAEIYLEQGYSVLMPDLRATGQSEGDRISFGWHEKLDLISWYYYLKSIGYNYIAAHGHSMGAATICYALEEIKDFKFLVLESCYRHLFEVVQSGLKMFYVPQVAAHLIVPLGQQLIGYMEDKMHPGDFLQLSDAPLLMLGGDSEQLVPAETTISLFSTNKARFSKLHLFKGATHVIFSDDYNEEFKEVMTDFIDKVEFSEKQQGDYISPAKEEAIHEDLFTLS